MKEEKRSEENMKPVVFVKGRYNYNQQDLFRQNILLKAMSQTTNVNELQNIVGAKSKIELYRMMDKLSMRKEYHKALDSLGINFITIVEGIKKVAETGDKDATKLKALQVLLKSLGMDEYKDSATGSGETWEELLREQIETGEIKKGDAIDVKYKVNMPEPPPEEQERLEEEKLIGHGLYE